MLTASLGIARTYRRRGGKRFDVGNGRAMTAREIAMASGCNVSAVYARLQSGWQGSDLLRPHRAKLYDCGNGLRLTIRQIQERTGLSENSVRSRISRGITGRDLLRKGRRDMAAPRSSTMVLACRLADAYPDRLPTTKEIRRMHPMSEQTAERWLTALRAARERT